MTILEFDYRIEFPRSLSGIPSRRFVNSKIKFVLECESDYRPKFPNLSLEIPNLSRIEYSNLSLEIPNLSSGREKLKSSSLCKFQDLSIVLSLVVAAEFKLIADPSNHP